MSLSQPINPPTINPGISKPVSSGAQLGTLSNLTQVNQLHGLSPNNAIGSGIPKQVSNVQVSIANAQTGATCTITVLFRRDSSDKAFSGVNIWVKGYQGNGQLVQVSSGTESPTKFVLNNTGETVSFTIQAFGNGGNAPITQAPTSSGVLPKSTTGGFGSSTTNYYNVTNPPPTSAVNGDCFYGPGLVNFTPVYGGSSVGGTISTTANQITAWKFTLFAVFTIKRVSVIVTTARAASTINVGLWDSTRTNKLIDVSLNSATTGNKSATITPLTLNPGTYYLGASASDTLVNALAATLASTQGTDQLNAGSVRVGQSPNLTIANVMPAALGTIVADTIYPNVILALFE